jgi:hypothetical protein
MPRKINNNEKYFYSDFDFYLNKEKEVDYTLKETMYDTVEFEYQVKENDSYKLY